MAPAAYRPCSPTRDQTRHRNLSQRWTYTSCGGSGRRCSTWRWLAGWAWPAGRPRRRSRRSVLGWPSGSSSWRSGERVSREKLQTDNPFNPLFNPLYNSLSIAHPLCAHLWCAPLRWHDGPSRPRRPLAIMQHAHLAHTGVLPSTARTAQLVVFPQRFVIYVRVVGGATVWCDGDGIWDIRGSVADNMLIVMLLNAATQCLWPTVPTGCGPQPAKRVHTPRAAWRAAPPRADLIMTPPFWYLIYPHT
mmetsp:Transcript_53178/g.119377  ORF Transcript_53178/g.119377 Transcript_53178/m.119377 type:complete len:247 (-) Transcript_53178:44-784(-)